MFVVVFTGTNLICSIHITRELAEKAMIKAIKINLNAVTSNYHVDDDQCKTMDEFEDRIDQIFDMYTIKECIITFAEDDIC
jgi:hypothetical protein